MSVVTANNSKGDKSKKFQSLDINNIYQGSATKPQQKTIPQKHGLQSLGKIPTARRAPANLPSLKAEHHGNDPTIAIVPTGSSGWAGKDDKSNAEKPNAPSSNGQAKLETGNVVEQTQNLTNNFNQPQTNVPQQQIQIGTGDPNQPKTWRNVTQTGTRAAQVAAAHARQNLLNHKSPLFGQEFPSLSSSIQTTTGNEAAVNSSNPTSSEIKHESSPILDVTASQKVKGQTSPLIGANDAQKYGPGPNLRPQFGNWSFGGGSKINNEQTPSAQQIQPNQPPSDGNINTNGPAVPSGHINTISNESAAAIAVNRVQPIQREIPINQFKFDVSPKSPLIPQHTALIRKSITSESGLKKLTPQLQSNRQGGRYANPGKNEYRNNKADNVVFQQSIIDNEKLKRMDDFDRELNDDDWARSDETFDYNKKIASDDEDENGKRTHPDWADQIKPSGKPLEKRISLHNSASSSSNSFEQSYNSQSHRQRPLSSEGSFLDEEEQRRAKKNEEVLKNIERARRRREEEEQKYNKNGQHYEFPPQLLSRNPNEDNRIGRDNYHGRNQTSRQQFNDDRNSLNNRRSPGNYRGNQNNNERSNREENDNRHSGNSAKSSFGKFDVVGGPASQQQLNDHDKPPSNESSDDKTFTHNERKPIQILQPPQHAQYDNGGAYAPRKQMQQQSSVPPRFKRYGGELHAFKRSSPPKDVAPSTPSSADVESNDNEGDKETSPSSSRSQSSKEKELGTFLRSSSGTSNNRKSPGNLDRHSNHSNAGSTVGGCTDKEDTDKTSTSSKDDYRKENMLQLSGNFSHPGRNKGAEQGKEFGPLSVPHGEKDNGYDNTDLSSIRLSQERCSAERMPNISQVDMSRSTHGNRNNSGQYDESRSQRDSRVRSNEENFHSYEDGRMEPSYHMTKRHGASNAHDRREHLQQHPTNQNRHDNRYDLDNRDRRDRMNKTGKPHNDDFRERRDRDYDRLDRNRDKIDRDIRSTRGGRTNRDNRGIYGSRSESNVPNSFVKIQPSNIASGQQKTIVLPLKSSQVRNQQITDEETHDSSLTKPKQVSGDLDHLNATKELEAKMKNLGTNQTEAIITLAQRQTTNIAPSAVATERNEVELLPSESANDENTLEVGGAIPSISETAPCDLVTSTNAVDQENSSGWFAARGQPSRRGRGGLSNISGATRNLTRNDQEAAAISGMFVDSSSTSTIQNKQGRASLPRTTEDEWDTASDKSFEENAKRGSVAQPSDEKYYERSKQPQREKGIPRDIRKPEKDERQRKQEGIPESHFVETSSFGDNRRRIERDDSRRGKYDTRGGVDRGGEKRGLVVERGNVKQPNYDTRRQKQLPPRLAKQKEASRVMGGLTNAQMDITGWGEPGLEQSSYQTWEQNVQQTSQISQTQGVQQQSQQSRGNQMVVGDFGDHTSMIQQPRYIESGNPIIQASGDNSQNIATGSESQHGRNSAPPVQTIIFENTNLKSGRGNPIGISNAMTAGTTSVNDQLVYKTSAHPASGAVANLQPDPIQMPPIGGFVTNKNEDSDLKLDFTFEADITHNVEVDKVVDSKSGSIVGQGNTPRCTVGHHPTEDLSAKIANVKKVWEMPSMSPATHTDSGPNNNSFNQGFATSTLGSSDEKGYRQPGTTNEVSLDADNTIHSVSSSGNGASSGSSNAYGSLPEKAEGVTPNVAKVRPQQIQQQQQHMSHPHPSHGAQQAAASIMQAHQAQTSQQVLEERVAAITRSTAAAVVGHNNGSTLNGTAGNRFTGATGLNIGSGALPTLQSPQLLNQAPSLYQAFQLDHAGRGGMTTNPLYSAYAGLGGQSVLLSSSGLSPGNGNIFGASAAGSQFRLQDASNATQFAGATQQSSGNAMLLSQSNLMSSAMKQSSQIGPIGTKGGSGPFQQSGIGTLPASGTSPLHLIQSDGQGYINYMTPNTLQRSSTGQGPGQTAFYQALAASTQQQQQQQQQQQVVSRQQAVSQQAAGVFSGVQGYGNQQGLTQQQQMTQAAQLRNQAAAAAAAAAGAPHPNVSGIPYSREQQAAAVAAAMKQQAHSGITRTESFNSVQTNGSAAHGNNAATGQANLGQLQAHHFQQHQMQPKVSMNAVQMANMSSLVNATGGHSNRPSGPTYSPTPIQRPHMGQGKPMNDEESIIENGPLKDKTSNDEN